MCKIFFNFLMQLIFLKVELERGLPNSLYLVVNLYLKSMWDNIDPFSILEWLIRQINGV